MIILTKEFKSCCFTGYRPEKFPFELNRRSKEFKQLENKLIDAVFSLPDEGCYTFYTGMAMGFDIVAAEAVLLLRETYKKAKINLICVVPFLEQSAAFSREWKRRYNNILGESDEVILLSDRYHKSCYRKRNEFMVDNSDFVITWFDGKYGGTRNTLCYAEKKGKKIINLNQYGVHEYIYDNDYELI